MNIKNRYLYLSLVLVQVVLVFIALPAFFAHHGNIMFFNAGDGLKNYFTLTSYVHEPIGTGGLFKYNTLAYPFGDYVYYTDNTPLFSIPFRWFCHNVHDLSAHTISAYNTFIISNIILSSLLVFFIFKKLLGKHIFSYTLAVVLPWINIQTPRIWEGDFNLSYSSLILGVLCLFIAWYSNRDVRKQVAIGIGMIALLFLSFLMHGYYIAITSMFMGGMLFFLGMALFREKYGKLSLLMSVIIPVLSLASVLGLLHFTDSYLKMRPTNAMCYDCAILKTNFFLLFTHYDFHSLAFPLASTRAMDIESMVYLGNTGLFAFAGIWIGAVFSKSFRLSVFGIQKDFFADPLKRSIFWAGFVMLMISFGEHYSSNRDVIKIYTPFEWINNVNTGKLLLIICTLAVLIYALILIINDTARKNLKQTGRDYAAHPYKKAGLLLCTGLMIYLFIARYSVVFINILNPFLYLHFVTKEVEQFRSLSRFIWPFFWAFYIWIAYTLIQLYYQSGKRTKGIILWAFLMVGGLEVADYLVKARHTANNDNLFMTDNLKKFDKLKIDATQYQAILPIPYYVVGSEDYPHTIDDNNDWSRYTMQLSLYSHLPLMACKMSRTPQKYTMALLNLVSNDSMDAELKSKLNDKPILITLDRALVNDPGQAEICTGGRQITKDYYLKANDFVNRHHLLPIDSMGSVLFYSWRPI